jgi:hypothetical protein
LPCLHLATRHVPIVLLFNGTRTWERRLLRERFPSIPSLDLRALPKSIMSHGLVLEILLRVVDRDFGIHDPDLYVFDPDLYRALEPRTGELAVGAFGVTNPRTARVFPTTHLLALCVDATRRIMERHRIGPNTYRRTPHRLSVALQSVGLGDHNFPKPYLKRYDVLHLLFAMAIHEGYALRALGGIDDVDGVLHIGGVSYLGDNYHLDYLHMRFLRLPMCADLVAPYSDGLVGGRSFEGTRQRFHAAGAGAQLDRIDALLDRLEAELASSPQG